MSISLGSGDRIATWLNMISNRDISTPSNSFFLYSQWWERSVQPKPFKVGSSWTVCRTSRTNPRMDERAWYWTTWPYSRWLRWLKNILPCDTFFLFFVVVVHCGCMLIQFEQIGAPSELWHRTRFYGWNLDTFVCV